MNWKNHLQRIQIADRPTPSIQTLQLLQKQHLLNIPFENLDIHFGKKIILDLPKIYDKIIKNGRGGFCYELNSLFHALLSELGFEVKMIAANVYNAEKKKYGIEFDHMTLIVRLEGEEYLTDVGFGEFTFFPLKLELGNIQKDPRGEFFLDKISDQVFRINKIENEITTPQYIFKTDAWELKDYEYACHYHQTSPDSHFTHKKVISRPTENGRITLAENLLKIKSHNETQEIHLKNENDFIENLMKYFNIKI